MEIEWEFWIIWNLVLEMLNVVFEVFDFFGNFFWFLKSVNFYVVIIDFVIKYVVFFVDCWIELLFLEYVVKRYLLCVILFVVNKIVS